MAGILNLVSPEDMMTPQVGKILCRHLMII
jgi:hypothetical protein